MNASFRVKRGRVVVLILAGLMSTALLPAAAGAAVPAISGFSPIAGPVGKAVTVSGSGFSGATDVSFNGSSASFTVVSDVKITTSVPNGALTGPISVTNADGTAASASSFKV